MLYGIIACIDSPISSAPAAARGVFDFINNTYSWDGTTLTLDQVIDHDEWRTGSGLIIPDDSYATILYAPLTSFLGNCQLTIVAECPVDTATPPYYQDILAITGDSGNYYIDFSWEFAFRVADNSDLNGDFIEDDVNAQTDGTYRAAMTRKDGHRAVSVAGNAVLSNDANMTTLPVIANPMDGFFIGGQPFGNSNGYALRYLAIYDPVSDARLLTLSA